nr:condensation domain-containing protein [Streptomyces sp. TSRI0281]
MERIREREGPLCWRQWVYWKRRHCEPEQIFGRIRPTRVVGRDHLARALHRLITRHEGLRTTCESGPDGSARQVVWQADGLVRDVLREFPEGAESVAGAVLLLSPGHDMTVDLPLACALVPQPSGLPEVALSVHHVATDLHGFHTLVDELGRLLEDDEASLPGTVMQPIEVASYEQSSKGASNSALAIEYHSSQLDIAEDFLPRFWRRAPVPDDSQIMYSLRSTRLRAGLRKHSLVNRVTPATLLLAALAKGFSSVTGQPDMMFFLTVSNRQISGMQRSICSLSQMSLISLCTDSSLGIKGLMAQSRNAIERGIRHGHFDQRERDRITIERFGAKKGLAVLRLNIIHEPSSTSGQNPTAVPDSPAADREVQISRQPDPVHKSPHLFGDNPLIGSNALHVTVSEECVSLMGRVSEALVGEPDVLRILDTFESALE